MGNESSMRRAVEVTGIPFSSLQMTWHKKFYLKPSMTRKTMFVPDVEKGMVDLDKKWGISVMSVQYNR